MNGLDGCSIGRLVVWLVCEMVGHIFMSVCRLMFNGLVRLLQDGPQKHSRCCGEENKFYPYQDLNLGPSGRWNCSYTDHANRATKMSP